jgi:PEP-CTERM motif
MFNWVRTFPLSNNLCVASTMLLAALPMQATNLVTNGSFTGSPSASAGSAGYWAVPTTSGGAGLPNGWNVAVTGGTPLDCIVTNNSASLVTSATGNVCGAAEGQTWGFNYSVQAPPGGGNYFGMDASAGYNAPLYQTISGLTAGQQYVLTFEAAADQQNGFTQSITANWGVDAYGNPGGSTLPPSTFAGNYISIGAQLTPVNNEAWTAESYTFTAASAMETIAFLANSPAGSGPPFALLSNVSLTATPEPGTCLLLGIGLMGIPAFSRLLKKR